MKKLTLIEAYDQVIKSIDTFIDMQEKGIHSIAVTIENVDFEEFFLVYYRLKTPKKRLYMPGELEPGCMSIIYVPVPGCVIAIESEPCENYFPCTLLINYN